MKRSFLITMMVLPGWLIAQPLWYGVTFGVMPKTLLSEPTHSYNGIPMEYTSGATFDAGAALLFPLGPDASLHGAVKYSTRTMSTHFPGMADGDVHATLNYADLSVLVKGEYRLFDALLLGCGPVLAVNLANELVATGDWVPGKNPIPGTNSVRLGAVVSAGVLLPIGGRFALLPEWSYDLGVTPTNERYGGRYSNSLLSLTLLVQ